MCSATASVRVLWVLEGGGGEYRVSFNKTQKLPLDRMCSVVFNCVHDV